nr:hypothetical protein [uncultured Roseococcus sp.]
MKDPLRSRGVVSEPRPVKEVVKAMRRQIGRFDEDRQSLFRENSRLTAERDEARANFGKALAAGAKAEQERDALHAEAFALAATQCATPFAGEYGHMECSALKTALARVAELEGEVRLLAAKLGVAQGVAQAAARGDGESRMARIAMDARVAELEEGLGRAASKLNEAAARFGWPLSREFAVARDEARALLTPKEPSA